MTAAESLATTVEAIRALVVSVDAEQGRWKPAPEQWSILEVINHLADEEVEDFRRRLDLLLHHAGAGWPPLDPQGWVTERGYNQRDPAESLERFLSERQRSLEWLRALKTPDWARSYTHPAMGRISAGGLLAAWAAHDLLHIRQLARLRFEHLAAQAESRALEYAGDW